MDPALVALACEEPALVAMAYVVVGIPWLARTLEGVEVGMQTAKEAAEVPSLERQGWVAWPGSESAPSQMAGKEQVKQAERPAEQLSPHPCLPQEQWQKPL